MAIGRVLAAVLLLQGFAASAHADCVIDAKEKQRWQLLDTHTILLTGGIGDNIVIKTFAFIYSSSSVLIMKDSFCSYEDAVLYIDGEVVDAQAVTKL